MLLHAAASLRIEEKHMLERGEEGGRESAHTPTERRGGERESDAERECRQGVQS